MAFSKHYNNNTPKVEQNFRPSSFRGFFLRWCAILTYLLTYLLVNAAVYILIIILY